MGMSGETGTSRKIVPLDLLKEERQDRLREME
jgi:hypothetical protein